MRYAWVWIPLEVILVLIIIFSLFLFSFQLHFFNDVKMIDKFVEAPKQSTVMVKVEVVAGVPDAPVTVAGK